MWLRNGIQNFYSHCIYLTTPSIVDSGSFVERSFIRISDPISVFRTATILLFALLKNIEVGNLPVRYLWFRNMSHLIVTVVFVSVMSHRIVITYILPLHTSFDLEYHNDRRHIYILHTGYKMYMSVSL